MGVGAAVSLEAIEASMEQALLEDGCACEMKEEQSPASCRLGDSRLLRPPLKDHSGLQKGLQRHWTSTASAGPSFRQRNRQ